MCCGKKKRKKDEIMSFFNNKCHKLWFMKDTFMCEYLNFVSVKLEVVIIFLNNLHRNRKSASGSQKNGGIFVFGRSSSTFSSGKSIFKQFQYINLCIRISFFSYYLRTLIRFFWPLLQTKSLFP